MGDAQADPIRLAVQSQRRVEFQGATVTSNAGLLRPREAEERLGVGARIDRRPTTATKNGVRFAMGLVDDHGPHLKPGD